ncbi:hypothetical protein GCM10011376_35840 [Nocardioides flavus (ex Wang et al. 2016)]|uniref:Uncharacterized protein n=1 Tax=Nocardioides flavus (ex Wang et al. 2016) TaxID=2058780 RepID=A0ABQ3HS32_9ACTN|nr:hypothetical protein GCM10011376_35840 [Nocardioides flavus (ex Wang et al. 2016)]
MADVAPYVRLSLVRGANPSPTLLVDGIDVATGAPVSGNLAADPTYPRHSKSARHWVR